VGFISDFIQTGTNKWNLNALHSIFDDVSVLEISKIHISLDTQTRYFWTFSTFGKFSTKSAYLQLQESLPALPTLDGVSSSFWKKLWKLKLNDRSRFFLWKIAWNILPTRERLQSIFLSPDSIDSCPLCNQDVDSLSHQFFRCTFVRIIWRLSPWPIDSSVLSFSSNVDWIKVILSPGKYLHIPLDEHHHFQIFAAVACDYLWTSRNKAYHDGISINALSLSCQINKVAKEHSQAWFSLSPSPIIEKWLPPPQSSFKINFDTAIRENFSAQSAVCRNHQGQITKAVSIINPPCQPNMGEALAAQLAISLAVSLNLS